MTEENHQEEGGTRYLLHFRQRLGGWQSWVCQWGPPKGLPQGLRDCILPLVRGVAECPAPSSNPPPNQRRGMEKARSILKASLHAKPEDWGIRSPPPKSGALGRGNSMSNGSEARPSREGRAVSAEGGRQGREMRPGLDPAEQGGREDTRTELSSIMERPCCLMGSEPCAS